MSNQELVEANRAQLFAWADEGRSYFWMAQQIGIEIDPDYFAIAERRIKEAQLQERLEFE